MAPYSYARTASQIVFYRQYAEAHEAAKRELTVDYPGVKIKEFDRNVAIGEVMVTWANGRLLLSLAGTPTGMPPQAARRLAKELEAASWYAHYFMLAAK